MTGFNQEFSTWKGLVVKVGFCSCSYTFLPCSLSDWLGLLPESSLEMSLPKKKGGGLITVVPGWQGKPGGQTLVSWEM